MAVWLAARPMFRHAGRALLWSVALFGITTIMFGLSTSLWVSLLALAIGGAADNISVVIRHLLVQTRTPDDLRGRTAAVNSVFIECSNEVGAFESGLVATWFTPVVSAVSGGIGTLAVVVFVAWAFPALRRMKQVIEPIPLVPESTRTAETEVTRARHEVRVAEYEEEDHRTAGSA